MSEDQMQNETENSQESLPEENQADATQSDEGDSNTQSEASRVPFHEDPQVQEYIERQLNKGFEQYDAKHQEEIRRLSTQFQPPMPNHQQVQIPRWFGGDAEQWAEFQADQSKLVSQAEEKAFQKLTTQRQQEEARTKEANDHFESSLRDIEKAGAIDRRRLLDVVLRDQLIDGSGRWNYAAGAKILRAEMSAETTQQKNLGDRKQLADASTKDSNKGGKEKRVFKTGADFRHNRPW